MPQNYNLDAEVIVAIIGIVVTIIISVIGGIYAIVTNTKKFELKENYCNELLNWYTSTNRILIRFIHSIKDGEFYNDDFKNEKASLISELSLAIEIGRFYFPNIIKNDNFGDEKPLAYQGYRHIVLEFLMYFYDTVSNNEANINIHRLIKAERMFTSFVFEAVNPRKRIKDYSKHSDMEIPAGMAIEDFIMLDPNNINVFL